MPKYLVPECHDVICMGFDLSQYQNGVGEWFVVITPKTSLLDVNGDAIRKITDSTITPMSELGPFNNPITFAQMYSHRDALFKTIAKFLINSKIDNADRPEADLRAEFGDVLVDEVLTERGK